MLIKKITELEQELEQERLELQKSLAETRKNMAFFCNLMEYQTKEIFDRPTK